MRIIISILLYILALIGATTVFGALRIVDHIGWDNYVKYLMYKKDHPPLIDEVKLPNDQLMQVLDGSKLTEERKQQIIKDPKIAKDPFGKALQGFLKDADDKAKEVDGYPKSEFLTIVTNGGRRGEPVEELVAKTKVYDASFMVYSKEFADIYHYPKEYVEELDPKIDVMELYFITDGIFQELYMNILLKPNLGLDLPKEDNFMMRYLRFNMRFHFPNKDQNIPVPKVFLDNIKARSSYENYYSRNVCLATENNDIGKNGAALSSMLMEYSRTYFPGYDYLSASIGANSFVKKILEQPNPTLWLKKEGGRDYRKFGQQFSEDFVKIKIPRSLIDKALPLIAEMDKYSFSDLQWQQRKRRKTA